MDARQKARAQRQERVAKVVWGTFFITMGVLFTLHDMGRIDLGEPSTEFSASRAVDGDSQTRPSRTRIPEVSARRRPPLTRACRPVRQALAAARAPSARAAVG